MKLKVTVGLNDGHGSSRSFEIELDDEDKDLYTNEINALVNESIFDQGIVSVDWEVVE